MTTTHADVYIARQIIEPIDDRVWCEGNDHSSCMVSPISASWPVPNPMHDLDDPDWKPM